METATARKAAKLRREVERLTERIGYLMAQRADLEIELSYAQRKAAAESTAHVLGLDMEG